MITVNDIEKWVRTHNTQNMSAEEIVKAMLHEAIDNTVIAEQTYPNLRKQLHNAVDNYQLK